ncbi:hypothetical protein Nmel_017102 [Mimus melanotis]
MHKGKKYINIYISCIYFNTYCICIYYEVYAAVYFNNTPLKKERKFRAFRNML